MFSYCSNIYSSVPKNSKDKTKLGNQSRRPSATHISINTLFSSLPFLSLSLPPYQTFSMASSVRQLLFFIFLQVVYAAHRPYFPKSVFLPVIKDPSTLQYLTRIDMGTPLTSINLLVDLGGPFMWVGCGKKHLSSSYNPMSVTSLQCSFAKVNSCFEAGHEKEICRLCPENRVKRMAASGGLAEDIMALLHGEGPKMGTVDSKRSLLFSCAPTFLLDGFAAGVKGTLGLGNTRMAMPSQLANAFGFNRKFSVCLSSSEGVISVGDGPYISTSGADLSKTLIYTPLVSNQDGFLEDYYINLKSIKINGRRLSINTTLLTVNKEGKGGTMISTIAPYTTMESTIYKEFTKAFIEVAGSVMNITTEEAVAPFGVCFRSEGIDRRLTGHGHALPVIDLVLQSEMVKWRIYGRNSVVWVSDEVMCLGFLDGGSTLGASIVIGGHQLEDHLLEFNLATSMLGFSPSLLMSQSSCSEVRSYTMSAEPL